jgi:hypothetical protein
MNKLFSLNNGSLKRLPSKYTRSIQTLIDGSWFRKTSRRSYLRQRERLEKEEVKIPLIIGVTHYIKRMTNMGLDGEDIYPLTVDNKYCDSEVETFQVPMIDDVINNGKFANLFELSLDANIKQIHKILGPINKSSSDKIYPSTDFVEIIKTIEDKMIDEFDEQIIQNH